MRTDVIELATAPHGEACAQVGEPGYGERARRECRAFRAQLLREASAAGVRVPETVTLFVKRNAHDFGEYYEVAVRFPLGDEHDEEAEAAADAAYWFDANSPELWDAEARAELGLPPRPEEP